MLVLALILVVMAGCTHPRHSPAVTPRVAVTQIDDEARAALIILDKEYAHQPVDSADWRRLFTSEGYLRLKERETYMKRLFTDADFRAFMESDTLIRRTPALRATFDGMRRIDVTAAARQALSYLPANARIVARLYPEIKPKTNTFVFSLDSVPGIFVYVDPARKPGAFQNTLTHELHHIGLGSVCAAEPDTTIAEPLRTLLYRMGGFGEGFAMLAASGSPDSNAHYTSDSASRARWNRDVANFPQNMQLLQTFFLDVAEGRINSTDSVATVAGQFYGEQGPWYTVGWKMAVVIEKVFGRQRLLTVMCDPVGLLSAYNAALPEWKKTHREDLPLWAPRLLTIPGSARSR